jgi:hypothetical protein
MAFGAEFESETAEEGKVMVCTARDCAWNKQARCMANDGIMINFHKDHADCNTYTKNTHIPGNSTESAQL